MTAGRLVCRRGPFGGSGFSAKKMFFQCLQIPPWTSAARHRTVISIDPIVQTKSVFIFQSNNQPLGLTTRPSDATAAINRTRFNGMDTIE
jgi:hypothetical protein